MSSTIARGPHKELRQDDFNAVYRQVFPKEPDHEFDAAWARWRALTEADFATLVLHPKGVEPPPPRKDDHFIFANSGPLRFAVEAIEDGEDKDEREAIADDAQTTIEELIDGLNKPEEESE